jgi:hypothetical protein
LLALLAAQAHAQPVACGDKSLPPEQEWNPPTAAVTPPLARFYELDAKMSAAYKGANPADAEPLAKEYLQAAGAFHCNWNYGNAIHNANVVLGLLALRAGKHDEAVAYLKAAGASIGSPQLNSYGPSLLLADQLARAGDFGEVANYLRALRGFWKMELPAVDGWLADLEAKRVPDFKKYVRPP